MQVAAAMATPKGSMTPSSDQPPSANSLPLLRWAGSKRSSVHTLARFWAEERTYIEPFCGSAALMFHLRPRQAILNDVNSRLINFYRHCQMNPRRVWSLASSISPDKETYYQTRKIFNSIGAGEDQAGIFFYLNRTCFNGIYRTNQKGEFNVPHCGSKMSAFPTLADFIKRCRVIENAHFDDCDFEMTFSKHISRNSFFFVDPPYTKDSGRIFTEYDRNDFRHTDLTRLLNCLKEADMKGARFVLTYEDGALTFDPADLGWNTSTFTVTRNVGGFRSSRKIAREVVVTNFPVQ